MRTRNSAPRPPRRCRHLECYAGKRVYGRKGTQRYKKGGCSDCGRKFKMLKVELTCPLCTSGSKTWYTYAIPRRVAEIQRRERNVRICDLHLPFQT